MLGCICHRQRLVDGDVHVEITVGAESPEKGDPTLGTRQLHIVDELRLFLDETNRVIRHVVVATQTAVFAIDDRPVVRFPRRKVLVLGDARVGNLGVAVVDHRAALIVTIDDFGREIKCAITKSTVLVVEVGVNGPAPKHVVVAAKFGARDSRRERDADVGVIEYRFDDGRVAVFRYSLIRVAEVRVVISETQWQARQDARWQFFRVNAPLLARVPRKERFIQLAPHQSQRLVFECRRVGDRRISLGRHERFGLCGRKAGAKERIDEAEVHRHLKGLLPDHRSHPMAIRLEGGETTHVVPHTFVLRVEDVWSVHVHHDAALVASRMAVARHVVA